MARISGVNLPNEKRLEIGLTYIFGIGNSLAKKILQAAGDGVSILDKPPNKER